MRRMIVWRCGGGDADGAGVGVGVGAGVGVACGVGVGVGVGVGSGPAPVNSAPTVSAPFMSKLHLFVDWPSHGVPFQLWKLSLPLGVAVSTTVVACGRSASHLDGQSI